MDWAPKSEKAEHLKTLLGKGQRVVRESNGEQM